MLRTLDRFRWLALALLAFCALAAPAPAQAQGKRIVSWGDDDYGQVFWTPREADFVAVAAGGRHSVALRTDGSLVSWGWDDYGQVSHTPAGTGFKAVAAGWAHSVAIRADGSLVSWGLDDWRQVSLTPPGAGFTAVAAYGYHSLAVRTDGSFHVWGDKSFRPFSVPPYFFSSVSAIAAGGLYDVALLPNGSGHYWNYINTDPLFGVHPLPFFDITAIASGGLHSLLLRRDGSLYSWGLDLFGELSQTPGGAGHKAIAAGEFHSVAVRADGTLISWGRDLDRVVTSTPRASGFSVVAAGYSHSVALRDPTPPVTTVSLSGTTGSVGWYRSLVTVTLTAQNSLVGDEVVTLYSVDNGGVTPYDGPFTVSAEGTHTVKYWSENWAGRSANIETAKTVGFKIDALAPKTRAFPSREPNRNGWYRGSVQVELRADDLGSGLQGTFFAIDNHPAQSYTAPFSVSGNGRHTVKYSSLDLAGNVETKQSLAVNIDSAVPTLTFGSPNPAANAAGWHRTSVSVPFTANDADSGVAGTNPAGPSLKFNLEGKDQTRTVQVWDAADNEDTYTSPKLSIDFRAPSTTTSFSGPAGSNGWYRGSVQVTLSATDALSGVAATQYVFSSGALQRYNGPFTVSGDGIRRGAIWSTDVAENEEGGKGLEIKIDGTAPATTASRSAGPDVNGWYHSGVQITLAATDNLSGVQSTCYSIDGGAPQSYTGPIGISGDGRHAVKCWSVDQAGNTETARTETILVDGGAPAVTASASLSQLWPPNGKLVPVTVSGKITDATSGVDPGSARFEVVDSYGKVQPTGAVTLRGDGSYSFTVNLEASRLGTDLAGRTYTITVSAKDQGGNPGSASATVTVPRDQGK
jgi:hypothetical protein